MFEFLLARMKVARCSVGSSPKSTLPAPEFWLNHALGARRHLGWSGWGSIWPVMVRVWMRSEEGDERQRGEERKMAIELGGSQ